MQLKKISIVGIAVGLVFSSQVIAKGNNSTAEVKQSFCSSKVVEQPKYEGFASCKVTDSETGKVETLEQYFTSADQSQAILKSSNGKSCTASIPFSYSEQKNIEFCGDTKSAPSITWARYEYAACNYYTRHGILDWESVSGASYQVEEYNNGNWYNVYQGNIHLAAYNKNFGLTGKSYSLRVRATLNGQTGGWHNFSVYVPYCSNGNGPIPK